MKLKANVLHVLNLSLTETGVVTQCVNNKARKSKYSWTSIDHEQPTFIWQPVAKIQEKLSAIHCNKNLSSSATVTKQLWSASYHPNGNSVLFYTSIQRPVVSSPECSCLIEVWVYYLQKDSRVCLYVISVCKMSGVNKDNDFRHRQLFKLYHRHRKQIHS